MKNNPIVLVTGTRPEIIKMAPLYYALKKCDHSVVVCATEQHRSLADSLYTLFDMEPDYRWDVMQPGQDLFHITHALLSQARKTFEEIKPSMVVVQGDTTSAWIAAQVACYMQIPICHVEAGLRTHDIGAPFPEEINRCLISRVAQYHCAPTEKAAANLVAEGIAKDHIWMVGNTIVDAVQDMHHKVTNGLVSVSSWLIDMVMMHKENKHSIMVFTMHRRESLSYAHTLFDELYRYLNDNPTVRCVYPYHPNPMVVKLLASHPLSTLLNIQLVDPLAYGDMIYLVSHAQLVVTDSGGLQEEAVTLSIPVIVIRKSTERMEGIDSGCAYWGMGEGTDLYTVIHECFQLPYTEFASDVYGDGHAGERIAEIISQAVQGSQHKDAGIADDDIVVVPSKKCSKNKGIQRKKSVCVVGLGYIGLPTALLAAQSGFTVVGFDRDLERIALLRDGHAPLYEPELIERLTVVRNQGNFLPVNVIEPADYFVIAVPTPINDDKTADLTAVYSAIHHISKVLESGNVVILESTVPVDTTVMVARMLHESTGLKPGVDFYIAYCPERVLPGTIFKELVTNDRIIGGITAESGEMARRFYDAFVAGSLYVTDSTTAELVKLVENSSRDVQLAFANQVDSIAESLGLNVYEVIDLANKHPRVDILKPTCGVGGHCIALDPWFLIQSFADQTALLRNAREINDAKPDRVVAKVCLAINRWEKEHAKDPVIAVMGLAYKPDVDDMRESPALQVARALQLQHENIVFCEPYVSVLHIQDMLGQSSYAPVEAVRKADIVVFLVSHSQFKLIPPGMLANKVVIDACGLLYQGNGNKPDNGDKKECYSGLSCGIKESLIGPSREGRRG